MIHIWHEDSMDSATTQFWRFLAAKYTDGLSAETEIRGFGGNHKLYTHLNETEFDSHDLYYIFMDKVPDNPKALKYYLNTVKIVSGYHNVVLADLLCFEYLLLKFEHFIKWTKPVKCGSLYKECEHVRTEMIHSIETGNSWVLYDPILHFIAKQKRIDLHIPGWQKELSFISSENIVTLLLSCMTNGGTTEFGVSKTRLGRCWYEDYCFKYDNDHTGFNKCRMYGDQKTSEAKARTLWEKTDAKNLLSVLKLHIGIKSSR